MVPSSGSATPHRNTKMLTQKLQATVRFSRYSLPSVSLFPFLLVSPLILSLPRSSAPTNSTLPPHSCSHCCCCAELTDLFKAAKDAFQLKMHFRGVFPPPAFLVLPCFSFYLPTIQPVFKHHSTSPLMLGSDFSFKPSSLEAAHSKIPTSPFPTPSHNPHSPSQGCHLFSPPEDHPTPLMTGGFASHHVSVFPRRTSRGTHSPRRLRRGEALAFQPRRSEESPTDPAREPLSPPSLRAQPGRRRKSAPGRAQRQETAGRPRRQHRAATALPPRPLGGWRRDSAPLRGWQRRLRSAP